MGYKVIIKIRFNRASSSVITSSCTIIVPVGSDTTSTYSVHSNFYRLVLLKQNFGEVLFYIQNYFRHKWSPTICRLAFLIHNIHINPIILN